MTVTNTYRAITKLGIAGGKRTNAVCHTDASSPTLLVRGQYRSTPSSTTDITATTRAAVPSAAVFITPINLLICHRRLLVKKIISSPFLQKTLFSGGKTERPGRCFEELHIRPEFTEVWLVPLLSEDNACITQPLRHLHGRAPHLSVTPCTMLRLWPTLCDEDHEC
jgi:hypothetical protein